MRRTGLRFILCMQRKKEKEKDDRKERPRSAGLNGLRMLRFRGDAPRIDIRAFPRSRRRGKGGKVSRSIRKRERERKTEKDLRVSAPPLPFAPRHRGARRAPSSSPSPSPSRTSPLTTTTSGPYLTISAYANSFVGSSASSKNKGWLKGWSNFLNR
ncbi:hypothetical protein G5I_00304 [Acromyrmex echinatior]|uniref:Uncharacterized protein n=1 Tax=Acromyrmex echinatior TaxID=103372 RepID=F4W4I3_ACREC|nr:hypothetical protein G5I_00304 [Acromyrmex echinatior]